MLKLTNRASESHETYTYLSKVYEESSKIVDDMLTKKYVDGESSGMVHEIENHVDTARVAKGIRSEIVHERLKNGINLGLKN
jgi:hypothetical protein